MERYIIRDGEKVFLTHEDEQLLYRQDCIMYAQDALELHTPWVDNLTEDQLFEIGNLLHEADEAENGDRAWNCLQAYGIPMSEPETEN